MNFLEWTGGIFWIVVIFGVGGTINDYQVTGTWWFKSLCNKKPTP